MSVRDWDMSELVGYDRQWHAAVDYQIPPSLSIGIAAGRALEVTLGALVLGGTIGAMRPPLSVLVLLASVAPLTPQRVWLDRLALVIPGPAATRWLLVADAACLVALGLVVRRPLVGVSVALGAGFIALNALAMALNDFYLGLAAFHLGVGTTTSLFARRWRWLGIGLIVLALVLGALT